MKIAITIWEARISPVFDSARTLLIVEIEGTKIVNRKIRSFDAWLFNRFLMLLINLEVRVLICGALCEGQASMLRAHGIEVLSFLTGEADSVLDAYLQGKNMAEFTLPGCRRNRCRQRIKDGKTTGNRSEEDEQCLIWSSRTGEGVGR